MSFTVKELRDAIKEGGVVSTEEDEDWQPDGVIEAIREECGFSVPGIEGKFVYFTQGRDPIEPGAYTFVHKHEPSGRLFALFGSYDSWNGTDIYDDDLYEVHEVEHIVKTWEAIKA